MDQTQHPSARAELSWLADQLRTARGQHAVVVGVRNRAYLEGRIALIEELLARWGTQITATPRATAPTRVEKKLAPYRGVLGQLQDAEVAWLADLTPTTVKRWRIAYGIADPPPVEVAARVADPDPPFPEEARVLFGVHPDAEIARRVGVSPGVVTRWREEHGLPARVGRPPSRLAAFHALFGAVPDTEIARRAGVQRPVVSQYRWRHPELPPSPLKPGRPRRA